MDPAVAHAGSHRMLLGDHPKPETIDRFCNEKHVTPKTPPTVLILSDDDRTVSPRNSTDFYVALQQAGVPAALYIFPRGGHGWGMRPEFEYHETWKALLIQWFDTLFSK
jgi:fermentation-respiration switch protein FrsA (DUF1100 family)